MAHCYLLVIHVVLMSSLFPPACISKCDLLSLTPTPANYGGPRSWFDTRCCTLTLTLKSLPPPPIPPLSCPLRTLFTSPAPSPPALPACPYSSNLDTTAHLYGYASPFLVVFSELLSTPSLSCLQAEETLHLS